MSDPARRTLLTKALEETGSGWLLGYWGTNAERMLDRVLADLDAFAAEYERRFREKPEPFRLLSDDPYKAKAFFQADTLQLSVDMRIMVWRILLGCEIQEIAFHYRQGQEMDLSILLRTPYGEGEGPYRGKQAADFRVLRHFGAVESNERLVLQGYYALK
ncbi:MAG: hypothetical protein HYS12_06935 [Planctomycetes bacterium]|nr:hypothetical protein [Planctomycetota bacterium]